MYLVSVVDGVGVLFDAKVMSRGGRRNRWTRKKAWVDELTLKAGRLPDQGRRRIEGLEQRWGG
jgi:hypothetical protein